MFDILMYLFENYMENNITLSVDNSTAILELERIGFHRYEINRALDWLNGLDQFQKTVYTPGLSLHSMRHYNAAECEQLGLEGREFLLRLEQLKILDPVTRETVIDRVMALDYHEVNLGRIKWIVLMALFNQPDKKSALALLQEMILAESIKALH